MSAKKRPRTPPPPRHLYESLAASIESLIKSGALKPGDRIPSVRRASIQHGVSITTAIEAYLQLENRGLIEARPRSGFFVRARTEPLAEPAPSRPPRSATPIRVSELPARLFDAVRAPEIIPLGAAYPAAELLPKAKLARITATLARTGARQNIIYDMPPGAEPLRRQLAIRSLDWGCRLSPDDFITTCGGTEAIALCLRAVTRPGDVVAVESPTYFGILRTMEELGLKAWEIPMHPRTGPDLAVLESALAKRRIAAFISVPNFSSPLGTLMPDDAKERLVEVLNRAGVPLIEDDINGDLGFDGKRPRTAKSFDRHGLVLLCGSASKTVAPGYRVGWVAPGRFYDRVKSLKLTHTLATASLPQFAVAEFLANGGYDHHLRTLRSMFARQLVRMTEAITTHFPDGVKLSRPRGGFVLWVELPASVSSIELHQRALDAAISIAPGPIFSPNHRFTNFIRISCGHPWTTRIEQGVQTLGRLVTQML